MEHPAKKKQNFFIAAKVALEISGGPLGVKLANQAHLGVENPKNTPFDKIVQNPTQLLKAIIYSL